MSTKNIYLFKVVIHDITTSEEVPVATFKHLFSEIFQQHALNNALKISRDEVEPMIMDIIEDTDDFLFAKLNRKRRNNSMQKRDYETYLTSDVLEPDEALNNGVELFTYCILGYSHGILSVVNSKGAPSENAFSHLFGLYNHRYELETEPIPNQDLIRELTNGQSPEINKVKIDIPQPDPQILQELFGLTDGEVLQAIHRNTSRIVFEVKPDFRGALSNDPNIISRLIAHLRRHSANYNSVILSGKESANGRQRHYDLYEEYFKYQIDVNEYRQENGHKIERAKDSILRDYRSEMMQIYDHYKDIILAVTNR